MKLQSIEVPAAGVAAEVITEIRRAGAPGVAAATAKGPFEALDINSLAFTWGYGTVMDSGSNMNYLVTPAFTKVVEYLSRTLEAQGKEMWKVGRGPGGGGVWGGCSAHSARRRWMRGVRCFTHEAPQQKPGRRPHCASHRHRHANKTPATCIPTVTPTKHHKPASPPPRAARAAASGTIAGR